MFYKKSMFFVCKIKYASFSRHFSYQPFVKEWDIKSYNTTFHSRNGRITNENIKSSKIIARQPRFCSSLWWFFYILGHFSFILTVWIGNLSFPIKQFIWLRRVLSLIDLVQKPSFMHACFFFFYFNAFSLKSTMFNNPLLNMLVFFLISALHFLSRTG